MDDKLIKILRYRYFRSLYKEFLEKTHHSPILAFGAAIEKSAKARIEDREALAEWAGRYGRRKGA